MPLVPGYNSQKKQRAAVAVGAEGMYSTLSACRIFLRETYTRLCDRLLKKPWDCVVKKQRLLSS